MKKILLPFIGCLLLITTACSPEKKPAATPAPEPPVAVAPVPAAPDLSAIKNAPGYSSRLGINLSGLADWGTEYPFADLFHQARSWISQKKGAAWGKGPALELDEHGWVKKLEPECSAQTPVAGSSGTHFPQGPWTLLYEGEGEITLWPQTNKILSQEPGKIVFEATGDQRQVWVHINSTKPENYIRNIHILWPGTETTWKENPFRPEFLTRWQGFNTIRFMDMQATNGSKVKDWTDRPKLNDAVWTVKGIPLEILLDLCNRTNTNPWFCIPHLATDDFVHQFARSVKEHLKPGLKAHIEFSNEVWNGIFEQSRWAEGKAKELGIPPAERPWEAKAKYYVQRSLEIFKIFEEEFGGTDRLVRVIAWQASGGEYWTHGIVLSQPGVEGHVDALAIAPYLTFCVPAVAKEGQLTAEQVAGWTLDQLFEHLEKTALPASIKNIENQKKVADKHGLKLMAYESGQHLIGVMGGENNEAMTKLFLEANRDPRMGVLYTKYMDAWKNSGADTMCLFSSTGRWSKWGSWGLTEFHDETEADQPKYKAALEWNTQNRREIK